MDQPSDLVRIAEMAAGVLTMFIIYYFMFRA